VIVLSSEVLNTEPWIKVGDTLKIDFGERNRELTVIGIVNLEGIAFAYSPFEYITRIEGQPGYSQAVMLGTSSKDQQFQEDVARNVEEHFKDVGIGVFQTATPYSLIGVLISLIDFFVAFLLFMAVLLGIVGGLGLASTMSLNVLERTREIGVMRAIGASNGAVRGIFLAEGLLIGAISYAISAVLSFPISLGFVILIGNAFFDRPMTLRISPLSFLAWLGVALVLASAASIAPANRAASISVRESLAYE
jgi:putative ABC transport system permease protein